MGSSNENSAYGPVRNPHDAGAGAGRFERRVGGSGGGGDGGGDAGHGYRRIDSAAGSFCGVVGVLPTYGRVSRYGLIAFASSLDRMGPFATNVRDAATMLGVIAGHDAMDATSSDAAGGGLRGADATAG